MSERKLCPFCGGKADLWRAYGYRGYFTYCECAVCGARSKSFFLGDDLPEEWANTFPALRAIEAWNRRASE